MPLCTLCSRKALFEEGAFTSVSHGTRGVRSWIWQREWRQASPNLLPHLPDLGSEARSAVSSTRGAGSALLLSSSGEVDVKSIEDSPPQFPQYEKLLEVVIRVVAKLSIDWPAEKLSEPQKSKLDERFPHTKLLPPRWSLPFFPNLHTEVSRLWRKPFSACLFIPAFDYYGNVAGLSECGYRGHHKVSL